MNLSDLGELGFIKRYLTQFQKRTKEVIVGIGDDCSVHSFNNKSYLLFTTDSLVEEIHFIKDKISSQDLGYKSLAVNLSDIAAKGGEAKCVWLTLCLPKDISTKWMDGYFQGFKELIDEYDLVLAGGDTNSSHKDIMITVAVEGVVDIPKIKLRKGAVPGDIVCTTGYLGESGLGLYLLLNGIKDEAMIKKHTRPKPHLKEGHFLANFQAVSSMMDVSDGISRDLVNLQTSSLVGFEIDLSNLPMTEEFIRICKSNRLDPIKLAASSGEDYCLLLTIKESEYETVNALFNKKFGSPLWRIGKVVKEQKISYFLHGKPYEIKHGYDHFL